MEDVFAAVNERPKRRQGITGQTIEAQMRGTMCQITEYELDTLRDEISRLTDERDQALARLATAHREAIERCAALLIELGYVSESGETLANEVRGLRVDPDAQAALDTLLAEARLEGWRAGQVDMQSQAYDACREWMRNDDSRRVEDVILALPEPKEASHD